MIRDKNNKDRTGFYGEVVNKYNELMKIANKANPFEFFDYNKQKLMSLLD